MSPDDFGENTRLATFLDTYAASTSLDLRKDQLSDVEVTKLLGLILDDYIQGKISVNDLSEFCEMIHRKLDIESALVSLLLMGAEIDWYIRYDPQRAADVITDLLKTFKKGASGENNSAFRMRKVERLLERYYLWADVTIDQAKLNLEQAEKIGLCIIQNFADGKISVDELALLCGNVYRKIDKNIELYALFSAGVEVSWDMRKQPTKAAHTIERFFEYFGVKFDSLGTLSNPSSLSQKRQVLES